MRENISREGRLGAFTFIFAAASFVPAVGIFLGAIAAVWGANTRKRGGSVLVLLGALGAAVSFFVATQATGRAIRLDHCAETIEREYEDFIVEFTEAWLEGLVLDIEFYRVQHGSYPADLYDLHRGDGSPMTFELIDPRTIGFSKEMNAFFYQRVDDDHYYLLSIGPEGEPFTEDDIVPDIHILRGSRAGLLNAPQKSPTQRKP